MIKLNIKYPIVLILILFFCLPYSIAQTTITRDVDLRFKGNIITKKYEDPLQNYPNGLMASFNLGIQWWTLMGEPMEFYSFEWESTQEIAISVGKYLQRDELLKYPDLLLRFDNLRPSKISVSLYGKCGLESFGYDIPDRKIMYSKAGVLTKNITPNSPETWNDFWQWSPGLLKNEADNVRKYKFKALSDDEKKTLISNLKKRYLNCTMIEVSARIEHVEWPKNEINSIYELYQKYEKGETEPSPKEIVEAAKEDIASTPTYENDDFWGEVADVKKPELVVYQANGGDGLKYKGSDKVVVPAKKGFRISLLVCSDCKEGQELNKQFFKGNSSGRYKLFDHTGAVLIDVSDILIIKIYANTYSFYYDGSDWIKRTPKGDYEIAVTRKISDEIIKKDLSSSRIRIDIYECEDEYLAFDSEMILLNKIKRKYKTKRNSLGYKN